MGHPWKALFLVIYAVVVVGLVDNVVKPPLMKDGAQMHDAVIFFALLGGFAAFGAMGLLIGPWRSRCFSPCCACTNEIYSSDVRDRQRMHQQGVGSTDPLEPASGRANSATAGNDGRSISLGHAPGHAKPTTP